MRELEGPKRDIWMLMVLKEASQGHASREPLTSRCCCVLSWSPARFHGDWQCVSSGTNSALNSCAWGFSRAFLQPFNLSLQTQPSSQEQQFSLWLQSPLQNLTQATNYSVSFWHALFIFCGEIFCYYLLLNSRIIPYLQIFDTIGSREVSSKIAHTWASLEGRG